MTRSTSLSPVSWQTWPEEAKLRLLARLQQERWRRQARIEQLPPPGDWRTWYLRGGRGSGKTRAGAETLAAWTQEYAPGDWAIVAPTFADARDVCVEGQSGLLAALGGRSSPLVAGWNRSIGELYLANGAKVYIAGADDGAQRIPGKNLSGVWADEIGLWRSWDVAWNESMAFAVRIHPAQLIATGTPKMAHPLVAHLLRDPATVVTHMRTLDNAANLSPAALDELLRKWEGTRRGRQELEGEYIEEVLGALWTLTMIETHRVAAPPYDLTRVVVGVDPSGSADDETGTSETGIVVAGHSSHDQHGYVLADRSLRGSPQEWAAQAVRAYHDHAADRIVAEKNFGGEMVRHTIHSVDANVPVTLVSASRGKTVRAEPVSALYERGCIHHVGGRLRDLETQMTTWVADAGMPSPDRVDALVWALTDLMVGRTAARQYPAISETGEPVVRRGDLILVGERYIDK